VTATMIVDGKEYPNVGVSFRGRSSYHMVPAGSKRSLNVSVDLADNNQRLSGYKTLNLLNANGDDSMLSTVLYSHIARKYMPAPKANLVKVVINGESWGIYTNVQQFNKDFIAENYPSSKGARWKVPGSPGGGGGLDYLGEDVEAYRSRYEMKTDDEKSWKYLINLCRTLHETPANELQEALDPLIDINELLWFLALDNALINSDGYWVRGSDYSIFLDERQKFHIIPHDMNEAFQPAMGPGMGRGPGGIGPGTANTNAVNLDPLISLDDDRKPLRSKVLAVPELRAKYLENVRIIAQDSLSWNSLSEIVAAYRNLIVADIKADTRKLSTYDAFLASTSPDVSTIDDSPAVAGPTGNYGPPPRRPKMSLRAFAEQRSGFLSSYTDHAVTASAIQPQAIEGLSP